MVNYLLRRTSILRHFSLQHFTSVVISLQTFIWHRVPAKTLWINHTVILSACSHLSGRQKMVLFSTSSSYFYWSKPTAQQVCLSTSIFSVKENEVWVNLCVLSRYSTFIQSAPAIKQTLYLNDSLFPPTATVTGCYLLDLSLPAVSGPIWLTDWWYFCLFCLSSCLPFCRCLIACLPVCISVRVSSWAPWKWLVPCSNIFPFNCK